uniref:uncharacterized protein LOC120342152 n=1 Tax=Styela clava TaxID=7725 RepID=UPI00193A25B3|nr:uncharacterized protein LOC120342152 [Styela clava]
MGKSKQSENLRPSIPTKDEVMADIARASNDDPVFTSATVIRSDSDSYISNGNNTSETVTNSDEVGNNFTKVCELLDMLSSMRDGKDQLENICHQLLNSKEDVSAVALQLKTRLDKQRLVAGRTLEK